MKPTHSFLIFSITICLIVLMVSNMAGCQSSQAGQSSPERIARDSLVQHLWRADSVYVVYGTAGELTEAYDTLLHKLTEGNGRIQMIPIADTAANESMLAATPHFLIGSPGSNSWLQAQQEYLPLAFQSTGITFDRKSLEENDQVIILYLLPSPLQKKTPLGIITANQDTAILSWLQKNQGRGWRGPFFSRWGYEVYNSEQRLMMGMFDDTWHPGGQPHWDFMRQPAPDHETEYLRIYQQKSGLSIAELQIMAQQVEVKVTNLLEWLDQSRAALAPVSYHLYPDAERIGLMRNAQEQVYVPQNQRQVHRIFNDHYRDRKLNPHEDLIPFIRQVLPEPKVSALTTGLAVYFTPEWQREGYPYWAGRLFQANAHLPLADLVEPDRYAANSPLVKSALSGAMVAFLIEKWGKELFLEKYETWNPESTELATLEGEWEQFLSGFGQSHPIKTWTQQPFDYYRGMTLAHEGYDVYNGYGSDSSRIATEKLADLNVNSIAIVPYTGSSSLHAPDAYHVWQRAGMENDASVIASFRHAKESGMQMLLKPQIWFRGGWPGGVEMRNEEDWALFHHYYRQWITHYAMLAAVHEMDAFCAGVEFAKATISHPEVWRQLIRDMRQIYAGPVTYAANWGEEAEKLAFGSELDFIGVNCYYPLSDKDEVSKADLAAGFAKVKQKLADIHARHNRPIVLTEVGFRPVDRAWTNPHDNANGRDFNPEAQKMGYEVVFEGLSDADWCHGMFWWKWPSHMGYANEGRNLTSFTPYNRPAMQVMADWYGRR